MNLPNALTLFRIFLVPVLLAAVLLTRSNVIDRSCDFPRGVADRLVRRVPSPGSGARSQPWVRCWIPIADKLLISSAFISLVQLAAAAWSRRGWR